ncbi:3-deoxy-D-manno-octulosonic acid transferase [Pannonibacter phragmitetus]|uniref:3-deoxy-D-manno-octulosonic acid transferase n=1 Tax=Pannonibacter phragmitetus TaxID=121719 RepID=UPI00067C6E3F|nr:3-deoxy-D-manno-octulosonic acid transferase [Pannonibacter phragmitetus]KND20004.1 3-deoxy-D-manno-octulosonic acid transferase [Pannonibacter phragmitetus]
MADARAAAAASFPLRAYGAVAGLALPVLKLLHASRVRAGKEDPARRGERFGMASLPRPQGRLVWLHAASVGETNSVLPLIERLTGEGASVLLTTVTRTSAEIAAQRLPQGAFHQYAPFDAPQLVRRFLAHWQPDLALVVESEIWPGTFARLARTGIPLAIINGRMSARSGAKWEKSRAFGRAVFGCVSLCLAQSEADAARYRKLGVADVRSPGNLKFDAAPPLADPAAVAALSAQMAGRPLWLAASTHPGEDEIVLAAHKHLAERFPGLLTLLMPRHPVRGGDIAALAAGAGFKAAQRSCGAFPAADLDVYIADTLGEMGLFLRLAPAVFLGGSFAPVGGHNPVEPAQLGVPLVTGPLVANARAVYRDLWDAQAAVRVDDPAELGPAIARLLADEPGRKAMAARAFAVAEAGAGALDRTLEHLRPLLYADSGARDGISGE